MKTTSTQLRRRILIFVGALVLLSLLGSTISLFRITEVNQVLDAINRVSVPLGRLLTQMQSDAEIFRRELDRSLGNSHWTDSRWKPRPVPRWIEEVLSNEIDRTRELVRLESDWAPPASRKRWQDWSLEIASGFASLRADAVRLHQALDKGDQAAAAQIYPKWNTDLEDWTRKLQWGVSEYDTSLRQTFSLAETRVAELRTGLEIILAVVLGLSLLLLWLGERALRPMGELTQLAREITRRGLRREDKAVLPEIFLSRTDEVSQLAREFHHMATALLEREKTVEAQKSRLLDQNRLLKDIGELNENILSSIESVLIVTDLSGKITQCNPLACQWLQSPAEKIIGSELMAWGKLRVFFPVFPIGEKLVAGRIEPRTLEGRVFGGHLMPLRHALDGGTPYGAIVVIDDLTEERELQDRLRTAENLAAVGRMSAQVAHEIRNPLHSLGLEAEMAAEQASKLGSAPLKQSLQSILAAVDRLEKITENYLKLSRLSSGDKRELDIGDAVESVLAAYASVAESQGVRIDWKREQGADLRVRGDRDLLEQILGNLLKNALQALEGADPATRPEITWKMGSLESARVWLRIEDNGPGVAPEVRGRLFTPFVTTRAAGTGLGLSFVKQVVEDHGGTIELKDTATGRGACFEILLPGSGAKEYGESVTQQPGAYV